jgi:spore maturation protein CgeB
VATEIFPELQEYFEEDKEIIGFNGKADMLEKIKYYIDHPEEANAVRRAGREKALQFTWDKVWLKLIPALVPIKK